MFTSSIYEEVVGSWGGWISSLGKVTVAGNLKAHEVLILNTLYYSPSANLDVDTTVS